MSLLITNKCLSLLGAEPVTSIADSEWAKVINPTVPSFFANLLEEYEWVFSIKFATLLQNVINTNPRYDFSFALPSDFVRIKEVYETDAFDAPLFRYATNSQDLFATIDKITIAYVSGNVDVDLTAESFKLALAYKIIANLNARLLNNTNLVTYYEKMEEKFYNKAVSLDNTNRGLLRQLTQPRRYF